MKKQYITPDTELVVVNLKDSVLEGIDLGEPSVVGKEMETNIGSLDLEDDPYDLPSSRSLWDE